MNYQVTLNTLNQFNPIFRNKQRRNLQSAAASSTGHISLTKARFRKIEALDPSTNICIELSPKHIFYLLKLSNQLQQKCMTDLPNTKAMKKFIEQRIEELYETKSLNQHPHLLEELDFLEGIQEQTTFQIRHLINLSEFHGSITHDSLIALLPTGLLVFDLAPFRTSQVNSIELELMDKLGIIKKANSSTKLTLGLRASNILNLFSREDIVGSLDQLYCLFQKQMNERHELDLSSILDQQTAAAT